MCLLDDEQWNTLYQDILQPVLLCLQSVCIHSILETLIEYT